MVASAWDERLTFQMAKRAGLLWGQEPKIGIGGVCLYIFFVGIVICFGENPLFCRFRNKVQVLCGIRICWIDSSCEVPTSHCNVTVGLVFLIS